VLVAGWVGIVYVADLVAKSRVPVYLNFAAFSDSPGYVLARGTWTIEGDEQAFPLQTTEIACRKDTRSCVIATAEVSFGRILTVTAETLPITEWTKTQVVFTDDFPRCVNYVYTLDLATKTANGVRRKNGTDNYAGIDCDKLAGDLRLTLRDGFPFSTKLERDALPWFGRVALAPVSLLSFLFEN